MQETDAPPSMARTVEVKGWRNGLLLVLPPVLEQSWDETLRQIGLRLDEAQARSFWRGAQTTFICGPLALTQEQFTGLVSQVKEEFGLVPVAAVTTDESTRAAAEKCALTIYEELPIVRKNPRSEESGAAAGEKNDAASVSVFGVNLPNALYLTQTIRSGQRIVHDGHLVIVGDVNPGAEIVAAGDILVCGTLRGVAHAGCYGEERARIVALSLRPPQLRIASKIARAPEEKDREKSAGTKPEVARIENGEIGVFPL